MNAVINWCHRTTTFTETEIKDALKVLTQENKYMRKYILFEVGAKLNEIDEKTPIDRKEWRQLLDPFWDEMTEIKNEIKKK